MKAEAVKKLVKSKVLLRGASGTGKTHNALQVSFLFSRSGKKVAYIDPEWGCQKEIASTEVKEEDIANIDMFITTEWKKTLQQVDEGVYTGGFLNAMGVIHGGNYDLIVIDSMNEIMAIHKKYLEEKFVAQGYYIPRENIVEIKDPDTFTLPFQFYNKIYDEMLSVIYDLLQTNSHMLCTMHPIGDTDTRKRVQSEIDRKFDTIIELYVTVEGNKKVWYGEVVKNRGKDIAVRITDVDKKLVDMFSKVLAQ
jgi:archaellum biogenesis ATPase FlaH